VEVRFYFRATIAGSQEALALCSLFSPADEGIIRETYGALNVFEYYREDKLVVIRATSILAAVTMAPFTERDRAPGPLLYPRFYLAEHIALGVVHTGIILE
jgi:hypothetical protein